MIHHTRLNRQFVMGGSAAVVPSSDEASAPTAGGERVGSKSRPSPEENGGGAGGGASDGVDGGASGGAGEGDSETGPAHAPAKLRARGCTDICCLIVFALFAGGMIYITYLAATVGDPDSILYGADYLGNRCGRGAFSDRKQVYFPRIDEDLLQQSAIAATMPWKLRFYGLCVDGCPSVTDPTLCFGNSAGCIVHDYGAQEEYAAAGGSAYYYAVMPQIELLHRCLPTVYTNENAAADRCAFPQCDNTTNDWMECDAEYPTLWLIRTAADVKRCEVKFRSALVQQLEKTQASPLTDKLASYMAA